jgi:hypothetical protein
MPLAKGSPDMRCRQGVQPDKSKILALNKTLGEYLKIVKWYLGCNSKSKKFLHEKCYEDAKRLFNLNTALIQTARDKVVEILKSFEEKRKESSILELKRISIRFDKRCYSFSKTNNALTPYWLTLSLNRKERISLPIVFGGKQKQRIEEALKGEWQFAELRWLNAMGNGMLTFS